MENDTEIRDDLTYREIISSSFRKEVVQTFELQAIHLLFSF